MLACLDVLPVPGMAIALEGDAVACHKAVASMFRPSIHTPQRLSSCHWTVPGKLPAASQGAQGRFELRGAPEDLELSAGEAVLVLGRRSLNTRALVSVSCLC